MTTKSSSEEFLEIITSRIGVLRDDLKRGATIIPTLPDYNSTFTGEAFVETVGTILQFEHGLAKAFYEPKAIEMRDASLSRRDGRGQLFDAIAEQCPSPSRILNIGAGGDLEPIESFQRLGHEIICTDLAEDTVAMLRTRTSAPAFACDLIHLHRILPQPVDFVIGNSVLAYVEAAKLERVVQNVVSSMHYGGVFTFDLAPNPKYFSLIEDTKHEETCVNASEADPTKLLEFIAKYGVDDGIKAMAYYVYYRGQSANLAMVELLRGLFEKQGTKCATGVTRLLGVSCYTLRVSRSFDAILAPAANEIHYEHVEEYWRDSIGSGHPLLELRCIDRGTGESLARVLGIHKDVRSDPWLVAENIARRQTLEALSDRIRDAVLAEIHPNLYADKIRPYLFGNPAPIRKPMPAHVAADQVFHKMVLSGAAEYGESEADEKIDAVYAQFEAKKRAYLATKIRREHEEKQRKLRKQKNKQRKQAKR